MIPQILLVVSAVVAVLAIGGVAMANNGKHRPERIEATGFFGHSFSFETTQIIPKDAKKTSDIGSNEMQGFWCPNLYNAKQSQHTWYLANKAYSRLYAAQEECLDNSGSIILVDAYRSEGDQLAASIDKPDIAVAPEKSQHTRGLAVDARFWGISESEGVDIMAKHNWVRTVPNKEPWHFAFKG